MYSDELSTGQWYCPHTNKDVWVLDIIPVPGRDVPDLRVRTRRGTYGNGSMQIRVRSAERFLATHNKVKESKRDGGES